MENFEKCGRIQAEGHFKGAFRRFVVKTLDMPFSLRTLATMQFDGSLRQGERKLGK